MTAQNIQFTQRVVHQHIRLPTRAFTQCTVAHNVQQDVRLTTSWRVRRVVVLSHISVQQYICLRRVHSVQRYIRLPKSWQARRALAAIFAASAAAAISLYLGGCEIKAKSLARQHEYPTQRHRHYGTLIKNKPLQVLYTRTRVNTEKRYLLQCGRRRCGRVSLLLLPSSLCFSVSSGYEMQVQSIMEERYRAYLALFLAEPVELCGSVRLEF